MQELLHKQLVTVTKPLMDATAEYVLSSDFILPEYCPDVAVVLKCIVTPYVHSRHFSGDLLTIDGTAVVRVLYLDEERRCVRVAEFSQPFSCSMRGQSGCEGVPVSVRAMQDYVNCRAVSPRRVEVRGAFLFKAYAAGTQPMELPTAAVDDHLCVRYDKRCMCTPLICTEKTVMVNELLSFDSTLPSAEQLLGGECTASVTDCKLLTDKAIVKGQIYLHHLYTDDSLNGSTHTLEYTVPFSLIMDVDGARDGMLHTVDVSVTTDTQECVAGVNGPNTALDFTAKLLVQLCVYETTELVLMADAFHRDCPAELKKQPLNVRSLCGAFRQTATVQKRLALPNDHLRELLDVWVTPMQAVGCMQDGRVEIVAQVTVSMLTRDVDGMVGYFERPEEVRLDLAQAAAYTADDVEACMTVCGVSYSAGGDMLDLRLTVAMHVMLWETMRETVVCDLTLKPEEAYGDDGMALRLYYADAGESVWDIARHCHVSPEGICVENGMHDDVVSVKTVLLVPAE